MRQLTASEASNDEMERLAFEKWFKSHYVIPGQFIRHDKSGDYENLTVRASWRAWQAALKSKQVEV